MIFAMVPAAFGAEFHNLTGGPVVAQFSPLECGKNGKFQPHKMAGGNWCLNELYLQKGDSWSSVNLPGWFRVEIPGVNLSSVLECEVDKYGWVTATIDNQQLVLSSYNFMGVRQCRVSARL